MPQIAVPHLVESDAKDLNFFPVQQRMRLVHIMNVRIRPNTGVHQSGTRIDADERLHVREQSCAFLRLMHLLAD